MSGLFGGELRGTEAGSRRSDRQDCLSKCNSVWTSRSSATGLRIFSVRDADLSKV